MIVDTAYRLIMGLQAVDVSTEPSDIVLRIIAVASRVKIHGHMAFINILVLTVAVLSL